MSLTVKKADFLIALARVVPLAKKNQHFPQNECVVIDTQDGCLHISTTDMEVSLRTTCIAEILDYLNCAVAVPAKPLMQAARHMCGDVICLALLAGDTTLSVSDGYGCVNFDTTPSTPHPITTTTTDVVEPIIMAHDVLRDALAATHFAISTDPSRTTLTGMLIEPFPEENKIHFVATDRFVWQQNLTQRLPS